MRRSGWAWWVIAVGALALTPMPLRAQEIDPVRRAKVEAAYVLNFVRYTEWPGSAFADAGSPLVVAVFGRSTMEDALPGTLKGQTVNGRPIVLQRIEAPGEGMGNAERAALIEKLRSAHLLVVGSTGAWSTAQVLEAVRGAPVLTVASLDRFASSGGMLGLVLTDGRIVFEANVKAIRASKLSVSSKVLRLARIVER